ncbi:MAG: hypothetical protein HYZ22_02625 [Chloroflexi bacterium]|nr:hypothetical protein [Chloroflexota bacterium]
MKRAGKWAVGILLTAATATAVLTTVSDPGVNAPTTVSPISTITEISEITEEVSASPQGSCGYQWAYHDAPELTEALDAQVKALNPGTSARVEYFGEDCVYADGTSTFGAMETDFYVRLQVDDLSKEEEFGNWVAEVMEIVTQIPRAELLGNYGFVEFTFEKSENERVIFRVPIQQYRDEAQGKTGAELFQMLYKQP